MAILCNHQRSVPKGHAGQMEKLEAKTLTLQKELHELQQELAAVRKSKNSPGKKSVEAYVAHPLYSPCPLCVMISMLRMKE